MSDDIEDPHDVDIYASHRSTSHKFVHLQSAQGIARINLDRPPANVLSVEVMEELNSALESLEYQRDVKLVVVSGSGKYFSAGFDLADHMGDRAYVMLEEFHGVFENLGKLDKPTLGLVAGPALGAGCILAAGCDMVLAAAGAKFGHPEIRGGVFNPVAAALLPRLIGRKKAFEMLLGGATISAAEAERIGLITRTVADDKLEAEAATLIQRFQEGSAPILQLARRAQVGSLDLLLPDAIRHAEDVYLNQLMATEDMEEGLQAIMGKRKPVWKDK
jgi:cyclohexa-1,5-dienecarbonyl-CoA hydratase